VALFDDLQRELARSHMTRFQGSHDHLKRKRGGGRGGGEVAGSQEGAGESTGKWDNKEGEI